MEQNDKNTNSPALTEHYHKARRNYVLTSGLLMLGTLIGVEVSNQPLSSFNVKIVSPQAIPLILLILVMYFAFRLVVEWYQCDSVRRELPASRLDYFVSHLLGAISIVIYTFQSISEQQIIDKLPSIFYGIGSIGIFWTLANFVLRQKPNYAKKLFFTSIFLSMFGTFILVLDNVEPHESVLRLLNGPISGEASMILGFSISISIFLWKKYSDKVVSLLRININK